MAGDDSSREIFLVGSIPLADARAVFETIGRRLGGAVRRIPDGETGERLGWLEWQDPILARNPSLEPVPSEGDWRNPTAPDKWKQKIWYRLKSGLSPRDLDLGDLGYARHASESYAAFRELRDSGTIAPGTRFMIAIPSPFNLVNFHFAPDQRAELEPAYEKSLLREIDRIADALPLSDVAIQWDCAHDMQAYDGARKTWFADGQRGIEERLARIGRYVPADIELGYHFCYGSFGGKHFVEPKDMGAMVRLANAISTAVSRFIGWFHMPVPVERTDPEYFAPLAELRLKPATRLYLGLIHDQDGVAGAEKRITTAQHFVQDFGIATECGFGRRDQRAIDALIGLHAKLAAG